MKKNYELLKNQAQSLRKTGKSYGDIASKLAVPKSTLSLWLRDFPLSQEQKTKLYTKQIQILTLGPNSQRQRRIREINAILEKAKGEIQFPLSDQTLLLMGAALYWGEGSKGNKMQVTNSDPALILFTIRWIEKVFGISSRELKAKLNIYPQQNELLIKKFWSSLTGIPIKNFGKSYVKPFSKGYKKNNLYYGTIRIEVPKSGDYIHRVYGWTQAVLERENRHAKRVEQRWMRLTKVNRPVNLDTLPS